MPSYCEYAPQKGTYLKANDLIPPGALSTQGRDRYRKKVATVMHRLQPSILERLLLTLVMYIFMSLLTYYDYLNFLEAYFSSVKMVVPGFFSINFLNCSKCLYWLFPYAVGFTSCMWYYNWDQQWIMDHSVELSVVVIEMLDHGVVVAVHIIYFKLLQTHIACQPFKKLPFLSQRYVAPLQC